MNNASLNNQNSYFETSLAFHLIRKSANSLIDDLKYFEDVPRNFSTQQIVNILSQIDELEISCQRMKKIFSRKINGSLSKKDFIKEKKNFEKIAQNTLLIKKRD